MERRIHFTFLTTLLREGFQNGLRFSMSLLPPQPPTAEGCELWPYKEIVFATPRSNARFRLLCDAAPAMVSSRMEEDTIITASHGLGEDGILMHLA